MNRILAVCLASSKVVRQVGHLRSILPPAVPTVVMGGNLISRHSHNEPPPGSSCSEQLLRKSRETPERLNESEWREVLSSVQYQVTRRHATEPAWTGKYNDNKEKGEPSISISVEYYITFFLCVRAVPLCLLRHPPLPQQIQVRLWLWLALLLPDSPAGGGAAGQHPAED